MYQDFFKHVFEGTIKKTKNMKISGIAGYRIYLKACANKKILKQRGWFLHFG
jgi:hypothetical protein